jgi:hypothetical protein
MSIGSPDNEERRLLAEYETVTRFYAWAVSELSRQRGLVSRDAYAHLFNVTEDARENCERGRAELEQFRKNRENST